MCGSDRLSRRKTRYLSDVLFGEASDCFYFLEMCHAYEASRFHQLAEHIRKPRSFFVR